MKKLFFLSILLCLFLSMQAQTSVNIAAGGLSAALSGQTGITNLAVTGTMDARDFLAIQKLYSTLVTLDLSGITKIEAYSGNGGSDIYNTVTTYPADQIPYKACYGAFSMSALTTVVLPTGGVIDSIGAQAFYSCSKLTSINIPNGVSVIRDNALSTTGLTSIILPNSVTTLGIGVFGASPLTQVTLSDNLTAIPQLTFASTKLSSINIPASVTTIGNQAFQNVTTLTTITIPSTVQWLGGNRTFNGCSNLTTINLPAGIQIISGNLNNTFGYSQITSFTIPSNVTIITNMAFANTPLASLTFPANSQVTTLGSSCLANAKLTSLVIPENVTSLGAGALFGNATLQTLELPASLTTIGGTAFSGCTALQSIKVHSTFPVNLSSATGVFDGINKTTCILYVPAGTKDAYLAADGWKDFTNIQEFGGVTKQDQTIGGLANMTKKVGDAAFDLSGTAQTPITYTSSDLTVATISNGGKTVTILKAGTTTITAKAAANDKYNAAPDVTVTLTVNKGDQTISGLTDITAKVGDADLTLAAAASSKLAVTYSIKDNSIATLTNGVLHFLKAGATTITASAVGNDNYNAATDLTVNLTVSDKAKTAQTITGLTDITAKVGDADLTLAAAASSKLAVTYSIKDNSIATLTNGVLHFLKAGATTITASQAGDGDFAAAADVTVNLTVSAKTAQTISGLTDIVAKMGDADLTLAAAASSKLAVTYSIKDNSIATITNGVLHFIKTGVTTITASQAGDGTYDAAPDVTVNLTVSAKTAQTITGLTDITAKVGDADLTLAAAASSKLPVTYSIKDNSIATLTNGVLHFLKAGATTITASQAGDATYAAAPDVTVNLTVSTKTAQTITGLTDIIAKTGDADLTLAAAASSKLAITYSIKDNSIATLTNGVLHFLKAGATTITASQAGDGTYDAAPDVTVNLTVSAKTAQTITGLTDIAAKVGDADVTLAAAASSKLAVTYSIKDNSIATITNGVLHFIKTGVTTITASQAGDGTYAAALDVTVNLTVGDKTKTPQTITGLTDMTKKISDADFTLTATATSKLAVTYSVDDATIATVTTDGKVHILKAGTANITASQAGDATYDVAPQLTVKLTVSPKTPQTITGLTDMTKKISDADFTLTATATSNLAVTYSIDDATIATVTSDGKVHILKAGTANITASQAGDATYDVAPQLTVKLTVSPKTPQTITGLTDITAKTGDADFTLAAVASSTLAVTYSIKDNSIATVSADGKVHILKEGATTITASQAGDATYDVAPDVTVNFTVAINYSWLLAPAITVEGTNVKVVGTDADKFTLFYINDQAATATAGVVSLTGKTGDLSLKATTADGTGVIKLKVNTTPKTAVKDGVEVIKLNVNNKQ